MAAFLQHSLPTTQWTLKHTQTKVVSALLPMLGDEPWTSHMPDNPYNTKVFDSLPHSPFEMETDFVAQTTGLIYNILQCLTLWGTEPSMHTAATLYVVPILCFLKVF